jgi:serine phosphatase RsbU (regulator of sigma subunit)
LYSDGFIDQNNDKRERFGSKNFLELINSLYRYTIGDQKEQLVKALKNHQGDEEQRDDITVVGLQL